MAKKEETEGKTASDARTEKMNHNEEVYQKIQKAGTGLDGESYVDNHYVPRSF